LLHEVNTYSAPLPFSDTYIPNRLGQIHEVGVIPARSTLEGIGPDLSSLSYCLSLSKSSSQCVLIFSAILRGKEVMFSLWCPP